MRARVEGMVVVDGLLRPSYKGDVWFPAFDWTRLSWCKQLLIGCPNWPLGLVPPVQESPSS
jgi:hypothetical protein